MIGPKGERGRKSTHIHTSSRIRQLSFSLFPLWPNLVRTSQLPAKGLTLTLMANADRIGSLLAERLR